MKPESTIDPRTLIDTAWGKRPSIPGPVVALISISNLSVWMTAVAAGYFALPSLITAMLPFPWVGTPGIIRLWQVLSFGATLLASILDWRQLVALRRYQPHPALYLIFGYWIAILGVAFLLLMTVFQDSGIVS